MRKKVNITILLLGVAGVGKSSFIKRILSEPILTLPTETPEIIKKKLKDIPAIKKYFQFKNLSEKSQLVLVDAPGRFQHRRTWRALMQEYRPSAIFFFINDEEASWQEQVSAFEDVYNYLHDVFFVDTDYQQWKNVSSGQYEPIFLKILCNLFRLKKEALEQKQEALSKIRDHFGHVIAALKEIPKVTVDVAILSIPHNPIGDVIIQIVDVIRFFENHSQKKK